MKKILRIIIIAIISQFYTLHSHAGSDGSLEIDSKTKEQSAEVKDCFETINRGIFAFNQGLDKIFFKPVAKGYRFLPKPIRSGTSNALNNLSNVVTIPNNILQGQFKEAGVNSLRFSINTTLGIGGIFDTDFWREYEYLLPCIFSSLLSLISLSLAYFWLEESLDLKEGLAARESSLKKLTDTFSNIIGILKIPVISTLVLINFLFLMAFSMMHGTFILFTAMSVDSGGLGWSEMENGWIFAFIGLLGVIVQGGLIGPLSDRFGMHRLMILGTVLCGLGIASLPYAVSYTHLTLPTNREV